MASRSYFAMKVCKPQEASGNNQVKLRPHWEDQATHHTVHFGNFLKTRTTSVG